MFILEKEKEQKEVLATLYVNGSGALQVMFDGEITATFNTKYQLVWLDPRNMGEYRECK